MKYILLTLILALTIDSQSIKAQTSEDIQQYLIEYFSSIQNKDYDKLLTILDPAFKNRIPKDSLKRIFWTIDNNPYFINQIIDFDLQHSSDPVLHGDTIYCKIDYEARRIVQYTNNASAEYIEKTNLYFQQLHPQSFEYSEEQKYFYTLHPQSVILIMNISDEDNIVYSFIPYLPKLLPYMHYLLPQEVVHELFK